MWRDFCHTKRDIHTPWDAMEELRIIMPAARHIMCSALLLHGRAHCHVDWRGIKSHTALSGVVPFFCSESITRARKEKVNKVGKVGK
jgi:hypothetical protein